MLLPEIAKLFGILVDDMFKDTMIGYSNRAERLLAVYEATGRHEDFMTAYEEYELMLKNNEFCIEDYRNYVCVWR